jgi:thiamine biosynthesis lipoprotein
MLFPGLEASAPASEPGAAIATTVLAPAPFPATPPAPRTVDRLTAEEALRAAFPRTDAIVPRTWNLDAAQRTSLDGRLRRGDPPSSYRWMEARVAGELLGYGVVGNAAGKSLPITYLVVLGTSLEVRAVEILAYRESHGGEVREARFRSQFVGKRAVDRLELKRDIRNVAGATISCRSITDAVHDVLCVMRVLVEMHPVLEEARPLAPRAQPGSAHGPEGAPLAPSLPIERTQVLMGTTLSITAWSPSRSETELALSLALAEVARLEALWSRFRESSEVAALNRAAGGSALGVSVETFELLRDALALSRRTGGAFDPAAGALIELWRAAERAGRTPSPAELVAACAQGAWVELDPAALTVRLTRPGMALDLGAIGKGRALDRAAELLRHSGVHSALLNFGGEVLALGPPPDAAAWTVELRDPAQPDARGRELRLASGAVSTSANYERGLSVAGQPVSHLVDPRDGSARAGLDAVSVWSASALEADALSTALFVMGWDEGRSFAERESIPALFEREGEFALSATLSRSDLFEARAPVAPERASAPEARSE